MLRFLVNRQVIFTDSLVELALQRYHFMFLFIHSFLTVSLAASATGMLQDFTGGLSSVPALVARNLPKASNYFFSYLIIQGLSVSAGTLMQIGRIIGWALAAFRPGTRREKLEESSRLSNVQWGALYPLYTTFACVGRSFPLCCACSHHWLRFHLLHYRTFHSRSERSPV